MAHKSKTQRAKASAAKANRKDRQIREEEAVEAAPAAAEAKAEESKGGILKKKESKSEAKQQPAAAAKKETKPKKVRFQFLKDVRAEMKRVTWPTRQDVIRWTGVVVGALLFFGLFVAVLDNLVITPALLGLGTLTGA